ncbi:MAG: DUF4202 domain-containing protein [Acidimicrobiales bacterium]
MGSRLDAAVAAIDEANSADPNRLVIDGVERPKEQVHAEMMTAWVLRLDPDADDAQLLAARAHHLRRWTRPRSDYPEGRSGYLRWRTALKAQHAEEVGEILAGCGYEPEVIDRVQRIVRKQDLRTDPATQTHEDALCLTFLQTQFSELAAKLGDDKTVDVVRKTLAKMSERGRAEALALALSPSEVSLVARALAPG